MSIGCLLCVINNCFKGHLFLNYLLDFDETGRNDLSVALMFLVHVINRSNKLLWPKMTLPLGLANRSHNANR